MLARYTGRMTKTDQELERKDKALSRIRAKADEMTKGVMGSAEISAAAFGLGYVNGRYGGLELLGVPLELLLGVGLNLAAHTKLAGSSSDHLQNLGNGALAVYFSTLGTGLGRQNRAATPAPVPAA